MDDEVSGQQQKQDQNDRMATDRRTLLRTAGLAGAAGAALAGSMHGKFSLAPITAAQAQTATTACQFPSAWRSSGPARP